MDNSFLVFCKIGSRLNGMLVFVSVKNCGDGSRYLSQRWFLRNHNISWSMHSKLVTVEIVWAGMKHEIYMVCEPDKIVVQGSFGKQIWSNCWSYSGSRCTVENKFYRLFSALVFRLMPLAHVRFYSGPWLFFLAHAETCSPNRKHAWARRVFFAALWM